MKDLKRTAAAVTALMLLISGPFSAIDPKLSAFNASVISGEAQDTIPLTAGKAQVDNADYVLEIAKTVKQYDSLKNISQYSNAYSDGDIAGGKLKPEFIGHEKNKVIEVPVNMLVNAGVNTGTIRFDYDSELQFIGCLRDDNGNVVSIDAVMDYGINTKKLLINNNHGVNCTKTGTLATMLFMLPDDVKMDHEYPINFVENGFNFVAATPVENVVSGTDGYAKVTSSDPGQTTPPEKNADYVLEIDEVTKYYDSLKTVSQYTNAYTDGKIDPEYAGLEKNKVIEVPVNMLVNAGVNTGTIKFDFDADLKLLGCLKDENGNIESIDAIMDCGINTKKLLINNNHGKDCIKTGTLATLLFILPENVKMDYKYKVNFVKGGFNFVASTPFENTVDGIDGYAMVIKDTIVTSTSVSTDKPITETTTNSSVTTAKTSVTTTKTSETTSKTSVTTGSNTTSSISSNTQSETKATTTNTSLTEDTKVSTSRTTSPTVSNTTVPSSNTTVPTDKTTVPTDKTTVPTDKTTVPTSKSTVPSKTTSDTSHTTVPTSGSTVSTLKTTEPTTTSDIGRPTSISTVTSPKNTTESVTKHTSDSSTTSESESTKNTSVSETTVPSQSDTKVTSVSATKPTVSSTTVPVSESETKKTTEPTTEPTSESSTEPTTEPTSETSTEPITEPTTGSTTSVSTDNSETQPTVTTVSDIDIPIITSVSNLQTDRIDSDETLPVKTPVNIKCDDVSSVEGKKLPAIPVKLRDFNKDSYFHEAVIEFTMDDWFTISDIELNPAVKTEDTTYEIKGNTVYLYGLNTTELSGDSQLFMLIVDAKNDTPVGEYDVKLNAKVKRAVSYVEEDGVTKVVYKELSPVNGEDSTISIISKSIASKQIVAGSVKMINPDTKFYYAHSDKKIDLKGFKVTADIITTYDNGETVTETGVDITSKVALTNDAVPSKLYNKSAFKYAIDVTYTDAEIAPEGTNIGSFDIFIGEKGDIDLNHKVSALDGTTILVEFLEMDMVGESTLPEVIKSAKLEDELLDSKYESTLIEFARFLGDADEDGKLGPVDGTSVLIFVLEQDFGGKDFNVGAAWDQIIK